MNWAEIENIHKTIRAFPDKKEFLKSLYPMAFFETDIITAVEIKILRGHGGDLFITYGEKKVAQLTLRKTQVQTGDREYKTSKTFEFKVKTGFAVRADDGGITIIKYGPINTKGGGKK